LAQSALHVWRRSGPSCIRATPGAGLPFGSENVGSLDRQPRTGPSKDAEAVVIGRSNLVGKPVALLLLAEHCTVTMCHSRTRDLGAVASRADMVIAAAGQPPLIRGAWIKEGATVIDVGTDRLERKVVGDVEFAPAAERARAISPVPGGVGPMTIAMLLSNAVQAAQRRLQRAD
jgi:methylenetetrahydrofolate dehydrogenase (NADP+) / methenyltetrahydrofolate cyclohydrolase